MFSYFDFVLGTLGEVGAILTVCVSKLRNHTKRKTNDCLSFGQTSITRKLDLRYIEAGSYVFLG